MKTLFFIALVGMLLVSCEGGDKVLSLIPIERTDEINTDNSGPNKETLQNMLGQWSGTGDYMVPGVVSGNDVDVRGVFRVYPNSVYKDPIDGKTYPVYELRFDWKTIIYYPSGEFTNGYSAYFLQKNDVIYTICSKQGNRELIMTGKVLDNQIHIDYYVTDTCNKTNMSIDMTSIGSAVKVKIINAFWRAGATADAVVTK